MDRVEKGALTKALALVVASDLLDMPVGDILTYVFIGIDKEGNVSMSAGCPNIPRDDQADIVRKLVTDVATGLNRDALDGHHHWQEWKAT